MTVLRCPFCLKILPDFIKKEEKIKLTSRGVIADG